MKTLKEIDAEIMQVQKELADVHGTETEVYARIVGYYRAIKNWNKGKAEEFKHRKNFALEDSSEYDIHSYADAGESGSVCGGILRDYAAIDCRHSRIECG